MTRDDTAYLAHFDDLVNLTSSNDTAMGQLEIWVEDCLIRFYKGFRLVMIFPVHHIVEIAHESLAP